MYKRLITVTIVILLVLSVLPAAAYADTDEETGLIYTDNGSSITITGYNGRSWLGDGIIIPGTIAGKPVTAIADGAFSDQYVITSFSIGKNVASIGEKAFYKCPSNNGFTVDDENTAFSSDDAGVLFDKGRQKLIAWPLANTAASYTMPAGVAEIGNYAFAGSYTLESVTLPEGLKIIGPGAFEECMALTALSVPKSVTSIPPGAFLGCQSLTEIAVDAACANYTSVDGVLYDKALTALILYPSLKDGSSYELPATIKTLADYCFAGNQKLADLSLPAGLADIGKQAFFYTVISSLSLPSDNAAFTLNDGVLFDKPMERLILYPPARAGAACDIPGSVKTIEAAAFSNSSKLERVTIPGSVKAIGENAFTLSGIKSVSIPGGVETLGSEAYAACMNLSGITFGKGLKTLPENAFLGCFALKNVTIPENITEIGKRAFAGCVNLETATVPKQTLTIGEEAFMQGEVTLTINGYEGSAAQGFAKANGLEFKTVGAMPVWLWIGLICLALAAVLLGFFLIIKRRKSTARKAHADIKEEAQ